MYEIMVKGNIETDPEGCSQGGLKLKKKNGDGEQRSLYTYVCIQTAVVSLFAVVVALHSERFRFSFMMKSAFILILAAVFIFALCILKEIKRIVQKAEQESLDKENSYRQEIESVILTMPENSSMITVNLTDDTVTSYHGEYEKELKDIFSADRSAHATEHIAGIISGVVCYEDQKKKILELLDCRALTERFEKNEKEICYSYNIKRFDGNPEVSEISVRMFRSPADNHIEAVILINDVSDDYYRNLVGSYLATKQFFFTTIIFINSGRGRSLANNTDMGRVNKFYDYEFFLNDIYNGLIVASERDEFRKKMQLDAVRKHLDKADTYPVYVHVIGQTGSKQYVKYEFQYIDDVRDAVLLTVADETPVWEVDVLTGICNYKGFVSLASHLLAVSDEDEEFSVIVTNIKWFKVMNKIFGTAICDEFLKSYSETLRTSALKPLVVGRFPSSDHFIMLVRRENITPEVLVDIAHQHIDNGEREEDILITCGIYNISDRQTAVTDMVEHAIMAFRSIKDIYSTPYATFSEEEEERYLSGKLAVSGFDKALRENEFQPFYQPIYDAVTRRIVSAEALVRWIKDGKLVPPGMFIPALEENGSVSRVDMHISKCVTGMLKRRKRDGKLVVPVSINLSAMDFYANDAMDGVMEDIMTMVEHSLTPRYEITETAWADAADNRGEVIETMRAKGTQILIDDFGSGYSSFSTIRDFGFDILKIDMGFIKKIGSNSKVDGIVKSIINMAHSIDLRVVAEGVETETQLIFLRDHGCDYIQGYYFSRPLPEKEFEELLDEQQREDA